MARNEEIEKISHTFENGITVVNTTPHPLNFQDSITGENVQIPTSVPDGERTGDFVVNAGSNEVDLGGGLITTEFIPSEEGTERINEIKEWGAEEGKDVRVVGSMIAAQAYPMDVVGMVAAPGFERVPPQDKLMSVEKFTAFQGESKGITNDKPDEISNDKVKELEEKLEVANEKIEILSELSDIKEELIKEYGLDSQEVQSLKQTEDIVKEREYTPDSIEKVKASIEVYKEYEGKDDIENNTEETDNIEKDENNDDIENPDIQESVLIAEDEKEEEVTEPYEQIEIESPELDENTVGDSSEEMQSKEVLSETKEEIKGIISEIKNEISELVINTKADLGEAMVENNTEDIEVDNEIIDDMAEISDIIDEITNDIENSSEDVDKVILDKLENIQENVGFSSELKDELKDIKYDLQLDKEEQENKQITIEEQKIEEIKADIEAEEKEYASPSLADILKEEGFDVKEAWENVIIETDEGVDILIQDDGEKYTVAVIEGYEDDDYRVALDDEGLEISKDVYNIDEVVETINDFSGDNSDKVDNDDTSDTSKDDNNDGIDDSNNDPVD